MDSIIGTNGRILTVSYVNQNGEDRPLIRLQGKWLGKLGFLPGVKIEVQEVQDGLLIKVREKDFYEKKVGKLIDTKCG